MKTWDTLAGSNDEKIARFRHFLSEGFVNTFRVQAVEKPDRGYNFEPESTEGYKNIAARITLRFDASDKYTMVLELGNKGEKLTSCQTMTLKKVR